MGYRMAVNLRSKIDSSYKILICDISKDAISKYQSQMKGKGEIDVVENGFQAAQAAVHTPNAVDIVHLLMVALGYGHHNASR